MFMLALSHIVSESLFTNIIYFHVDFMSTISTGYSAYAILAKVDVKFVFLSGT